MYKSVEIVKQKCKQKEVKKRVGNILRYKQASADESLDPESDLEIERKR